MKFLTACVLASSAAAAAAANIFDPPLHQDVSRRLDEEADISWMNGYKLMYENCFRSEKVVTFRFCPRGDRCESGCKGGGEYLADLSFFIDAFTEAQMGAHEYRCEMARENCEYDDDALCYQAAGLEDCDDRNEDENGFNLQEFTECKALDENLYVGPYCSEDNYNIYLGVFSDEDCTEQLDTTSFYDAYGYVLPYSESSDEAGIIFNECADCREHHAEQDKNGGDDAADDDDVIEQCEELYAGASKCETDLDIDNPDVSSCADIETIQKAENVQSGTSRWAVGSSSSSRTFLGLFIAALILGCGCCGAGYWYSRNKKSSSEPMLGGEYERNMN